ncbi:MAG: restriction endonuclease [Phycisphaerales bacterium]
MARRGEQFEKTVFEFYRGLDADAQVVFDHRVPDRDTKALRQVDVWVTCRLFGHLPISVLISCKDHSRPLDVGEVETFLGEIRSTGATTGVLYGRNGFTENALVKARANSVSCCKMFDGAPPERPSELLLSAYVAHPVYHVMAEAVGRDAPPDLRWRPVLGTSERLGDREVPLPEVLAGLCLELLCRSELERHSGAPSSGPMDMHARYELKARPECPALRLHIVLTWDWFKGRMNAYTLTGSLNATDKGFIGSTTVSPISLNTAPHSATWERCPPPPAIVESLRVTFSALAGPGPQHVVSAMAADRIFGGSGWTFGSPPAEQIESVLRSHGGPLAPVLQGMQLTAHFGRGALGKRS